MNIVERQVRSYNYYIHRLELFMNTFIIHYRRNDRLAFSLWSDALPVATQCRSAA